MKATISLEKTVLIIVMATSFLTPFIGSSINLAIPAIGRELGGTPATLSWVVSSYLLTTAAFLLPLGRLSDIIGRKKMFISGIISFSLFTLLCGLATFLPGLIVIRSLQGVASAMIFSTSLAILTSVYPVQKRGQALGVTAAATYIGLSLGPVLGGFMNHQLGWRSIFFFTAGLGLFVAGLALWRLKGEWANAAGEPFDWKGSISYVAGIAALLYGFSAGTAYMVAAGLIVLIFFIYYESQTDYPILKVSLFRHNTLFAFSCLAAMINYSATFAVGFLLSLYLQLVMGCNSQLAGMILLSSPIVMALLSPVTGTFSDRIEPAVIASWGMGISSLGLFFFVFLTPAAPLWLIAANLAFLGLGFALFASPNNNAIMGSVDKQLYGVAASTLATMRLIGQAASMAVVTLLFLVYAGDTPIGKSSGPVIGETSRAAFAVFSLICAAGVFASRARGTVDQPRDDAPLGDIPPE
jgi:EmrB/QacA subfamily drug resistance transporter